MRITSITSRPVRANEITAAGPAELMMTPLPTKRPAPITPPSAIICMCRFRSVRRKPVVFIRGDDPPGSSEGFVLVEVSDRLGERVAPEGIAQLLRDHDIEHRGAALVLGRGGGPQGRL